MSTTDQVDMINSFLLDNLGIAGQFIGDDDDAEIRFFERYSSTADFFYRALTVVTAPVFLSVIVIESVASCLFNLFKSLYDLVASGSSTASKDLEKSGQMLFAMLVFSLSAVFFPLINLVDLVGAGVTSLLGGDDEPEKGMSPGLN